MSPRIRKYASGWEKRKKKKRIEGLIRSQRGALDKFVIKDGVSLDENVDNVDGNLPLVDENGVTNTDDVPLDEVANVDGNVPLVDEIRLVDSGRLLRFDKACVHVEINTTSEDVSDDHDVTYDDGVRPDENANAGVGGECDIYDPRNWDGLDAKLRDILAVEGPKRDLSLGNGLNDALNNHFSSKFYTYTLANGEKSDRKWLVYSKDVDKVFCFCCKVFRKGQGESELATTGVNDWTHLSEILEEHEMSPQHFKNMFIWVELRSRLGKNETIDEESQKQLQEEKDHWKDVLIRIIAIVKFLGKTNLPFSGTDETWCENNNGLFLGLVETVAEFDHVMQVHDSRTHYQYLGQEFQNELVCLLASKVKSEIAKKIKQAKYFSAILDCALDNSCDKHMSMILRYVDTSLDEFQVSESFLGFLNVNDDMGLGLFDALQNELKSLGLDMDNIRGQCYDYCSDMKGKQQGAQKRLLDINPRAFYAPCGYHSLNSILCDIASTCGKAFYVFGSIRQIYTIFTHSPETRQILKNNVKDLTLNSLASPRWESCIDSVKAIRFHMMDIREALLEVAEGDHDCMICSQANSLAMYDLDDFEYLVSIVIWYEILHFVNEVSKHLQTKDIHIDVAILQVKALILSLEKYRETGFPKAIDTAKQIAAEMDVDPIFRKRLELRRMNQIVESVDSSRLSEEELSRLSEEESFRVDYFLYLIDQTVSSLNRRLAQYQEYENIFGFMLSTDRLCSIDDKTLESSCVNFENALKNNKQYDVDGNVLFLELKVFKELMSKKRMGAIEILNYMKIYSSCYPCAMIAYMILLTLPVTVASEERIFPKLESVNSYLHSTMWHDSMSHDHMNGLAMISIENDLLKELSCKELIDDFASKLARRAPVYKKL